jgi:hypothetical protein
MFQSPENRGQGELPRNTIETTSEIQKIQDEVERIQIMIKGLESRKNENMTPSEGAALLGVLARERAHLTPLLIRLDQEEKTRDAKYTISTSAANDGDAFDAALRQTREMQSADRLDAARNRRVA